MSTASFYSCARINREITSRDSADQVLLICAKRLALFDEINVATALHRVAKLGAGRKILRDARFHWVLEKAVDIVRSVDPQALSNLSWSFATIKVYDAPLLSALAARARLHHE